MKDLLTSLASSFIPVWLALTSMLQPTHAISPTITMPVSSNKPSQNQAVVLKDVGEAYMDHFGLTDTDFEKIKGAKVNIIEGNFDSCATDEDVKYLLDQSQKYNLKVIMPAGSGEAEWGYACDTEKFPVTQGPVWQKEKVVAWVNKWKTHPAIYAWDTSNEAGSVFPNASWNNEKNSQVPDALYLTAEQLKQAYKDV